MPIMYLAVLHAAFETPGSQARRSFWAAQGHSVFGLLPTQVSRSTVREFPPDVVVVELGDRPAEGFHAVGQVLSVPRRRGDRWPLVLTEVGAAHHAQAAALAPHASLLAPGEDPAAVLAACLEQMDRNRRDWESGAMAAGSGAT